MIKESLGLSLAKLILTVSFIIGGGAWLGTVAYSLAHPEFAVNLGQIINSTPVGKAVNKIEISADAKSILNSETKKVIFTIADTQKYLKDTGYFYQPKADPPRADNPDNFQDTNAKYAGDCFLAAALSNNKDRIVFSAGCLPGDLPQAWVGVYSISKISNPDKKCPAGFCIIQSEIKFLIAGSGRNFVWSADDKTITHEADLGLSGMTETRTIDLQTGEILETKSSAKSFWEEGKKIEMDISGWKIYDNNKYGFSFNYPADWKITENFGNNFDEARVVIASPEILKALKEEKAKNNGENYEISDPAYNILIYYYPFIEEETQNKHNKYGAKNIDELIKKGSFVKIKKTVIDGAETVEAIENGEGQYHVLFIEKDNHLYKIFFNDIWLNDNVQSIAKKILSTFKFIEPEK